MSFSFYRHLISHLASFRSRRSRSGLPVVGCALAAPRSAIDSELRGERATYEEKVALSGRTGTFERSARFGNNSFRQTRLIRSAIAGLLLVAVTFISTSSAQYRGIGGFGRRAGLFDRGDVPDWQVDPAFKEDVFSFARLRYTSYGGRGWGGGGRWATDAPEADLNLLFRLQQMTSLKVNPNVTYIEITPQSLARHPFVYMIEPGGLEFSPDEVVALRNYLLNGGFLMVDDFWGDDEWDNFYYQIKQVFPDREPVELPIEHPIFHSVFDLKEKPQMPSIHHFLATGLSYEADGRAGTEQVHYRGLFDDKGRLMAIICHNTDLGDGWEREGEDPTYFQRFSEKMAYPMMINILFYAMTH